MEVFVNGLMWVVYAVSLYFSVFLLLIYLDKKKVLDEETSMLQLNREPFVSIFVPAYNEEATIEKTLQSIEALNYPVEKLEVIVINDGSTDGTLHTIQTFTRGKPQFRVLTQENKGKAASLNRALAEARGEFFACLDADSFVEKDTLRKMLGLYEKENNPKLAIVTPAMKVDSPRNLLQRVQWLEYLIIIFVARLTSYIDSLYVAPGPFSLYRTSIIKKLGGFDVTNITEDQEIAYRVQKYQYKIKQCFDGFVYTTAPYNIRPFYRQRKRWYMGSLSCLHKYKRMIGNRKYGDFGIMQMVKNVLGYGLAVSGILLAFYFIVLPVYDWVAGLIAINFNVMPALLNFNLHLDFMTVLLSDFRKLFIIIFLFGIGFTFFYLAHKNSQEKMMKFGWLPLIPYFLFYYLFKGIILLISFTSYSKDRKLKW